MGLHSGYNLTCFFFLSFLLFKKIIYLLLAMLHLCCYVWAFSSCGERGLLYSCSAWAYHCYGFFCCRAWALQCGLQ